MSASTSWAGAVMRSIRRSSATLPQVGRDGLGDARVLHLDRDRAAVVGDGPVHLPDRGGGDGLADPSGRTPRSGGRPSSSATTRAASSGLIGGTLSCSRAERAADGGRQAVVHVAGHLADLHQDALHRAQGGGHVLGGLQGEVVAELLPVLAGRREQPRRTARVAQAAADHQLQRRPGRGHSRSRPTRRPSTASPAQRPRPPRSRRAASSRGPRRTRIRRAIRWRASSTPGSPRNTASRTPSAWRISVRRSSVSGGGGGVAVHLARPARAARRRRRPGRPARSPRYPRPGPAGRAGSPWIPGRRGVQRSSGRTDAM